MLLREWVANHLRAWREHHHPEYYDPPDYKFDCPICGFRTLTEYPDDTYEICMVCMVEFGYDDAGVSQKELRDAWLDRFGGMRTWIDEYHKAHGRAESNVAPTPETRKTKSQDNPNGFVAGKG